MSVLATAVISAVAFKIITRYDGAPSPPPWPVVGIAAQMALLFGPILLFGIWMVDQRAFAA